MLSYSLPDTTLQEPSQLCFETSWSRHHQTVLWTSHQHIQGHFPLRKTVFDAESRSKAATHKLGHLQLNFIRLYRTKRTATMATTQYTSCFFWGSSNTWKIHGDWRWGLTVLPLSSVQAVYATYLLEPMHCCSQTHPCRPHVTCLQSWHSLWVWELNGLLLFTQILLVQ